MDRPHPADERIPGDRVAAERRRHRPRLLDPLARNFRVEIPRPDLPGDLVFQAREELARDAEAGGDDAARGAGVDALVQDLHRELAIHDPAQRGRAPELVVVPALGVQTHDEARRTDPRG